jgi:hypothetical protein
MTAADGAKTVEIRLPPDIFGRDPQGLLEFLGFSGRNLTGDRWLVQVNDPEADLITVYELANEATGDRHFGHLAKVHPNEVQLDAQDAEELQRVRERLVQRASSGAGGDLAALFHHIQVELLIAGHQQLAEAAEQAYEALGQVTFESSGEPAFGDRSAHLVLGAETLMRRIRLPAIIFRLDQDPNLIQRVTAQMASGLSSAEELVFQSSSNLFANIIGLARYFGPLLGCLSPRFWCIEAQRPLAAILFPLGIDINGIRNEPMEPLQLLPVSGPEPRVLPTVELDPSARVETIHWWADRLNEMFRYLLDPSNFANKHGVYSPQFHQNWLLNIDQVFVLTNTLLSQARDVTAQRVVMNDLLDTFAGRIIGGDDFEKLFRYSEVEKVVKRVRDALPKNVAAILMPAIDRALTALADTQQGFFLQQQTSSAKLQLRLPDGTHQQMSPEDAVARLMKIYRNATHGFGGGGRRGSPESRRTDASVLTHHNGNLPSDLVLLPCLYLLDMLIDPELRRKRISTSVARA